ncbi:MAG: hypothetical protein ACD_46C00708G0002 [uncultured bacterium]|nr:MAG: hypothetical protein ACD_46C00708G0002 [uncultured bacterium]OGT25426.1 MAG: hypothetical protein A3B71_05085 [Gammaproteobacteria bacterium RIFCSPHIGHO2_02_FULL_42_43]OGT28564.1 MAG: hypothetical protein A2624_04130 [Gammaproteobacteria bacterium RIFCSPHIGHO2_01_FULL_42_8]OGT51378.1 MAG: hypothetical protein A3E54_04850 [Gammaproteobacteria bacterium RIFCSPHIGHO2_12_FULL_41_25]OGT62080.1 MAG: hypothetical protein A3I77_03780 [Gammaproteobacteria bacterium RIFCSPLOWO2_02_FULL_42_14]OGT
MIYTEKEMLVVKDIRKAVDDGIYLNENRYENPKEMFKRIVSIIKKNNLPDDISILDVGCATGEFICYLRTQFPSGRYTGIDVSESMVQQARNKMPTETWKCQDILTVPNTLKTQHDIVLCIGTIQIFDNIETPIDNLLSVVKVGGSLYIAGIFNAHSVDVITRYRKSCADVTDWSSGWNMFSMQTYEKILSKHNAISWVWHEFAMPHDIQETNDPMRTWTIKTEKTPFQLVNGASLLINIKILEIKKENDQQ